MMKKILKRMFFLGVFSLLVSAMIGTLVFAETTSSDTMYTITFDGNGFGDTICELQVKSGDTLHEVLHELSLEDGWHKIMPEDFYYDGSKWYQVVDYTYDKSGDNIYDFDAPISSDITIYAMWHPIIPIEKVDVKIEPPTAGTVISFSEDIPYNYPDVSIPNDVGYEINIRKEYGTPYLYWYEGPSRDKVFEGTMEAGVTYYADVWLVPKSNEYAFTKDVTVTINSGDIEYKDGKFADFLAAFLVPVTAVEPGESDSGDTFTLTFDGNGFGDTIYEFQVKSGDTLHEVLRGLSLEDGWDKIMPRDFYYDGSKWYQLIDYTYDESGDNIYDFDAPISGDITIYAMWYPIIPIDKVDVKIEAPIAGTVISFSGDVPYNYPDVSIPNDVGYEIDMIEEYGTPYLYWYEGPSRNKVFKGTMEAGVTYYADVWLVPKSNEYAFTKDVTVTINSGDIEYKDGKFADFLVSFLVPVTAVEPETESISGDTFTLTFDGNDYLGKILEVEFKSGDSFWDVVDSLSAEDNEKIFPNDVYYDGTTYYFLGDYCYDKSGEEICDYYAPIDKDATIYALWYPIEDFIEHIDLTIEAPVAGTEVTMSDKYGFTQKPSPVITIPEGVKYEIDHNSQRQHVYWYEDASGEKLFTGTMEAGKTYYVKTWFKPISYDYDYDYVFAKDVDITVNSGDIISKTENTNLFYVRILIPVVAVKTEVKPSGRGSSSSGYKITTKIENGTITPANVSVKRNANQEFTFKANEGYEIVDVLVDGKSVGIVNGYKFEKVTEKHTIEVKTVKTSSLSNVDDWAKEEMARAEELGLIPETFAKKDATKPITRQDFAAVAVKLYEAISGKKVEPVVVNPFTDTNDEYVLKAYALGITLGTSETTFTPDVEITREQMATMLTRALNKAGINTEYDITNATRFADDSNLNDWGKPSVYFLAKNEIIKGVGDNRFNGLGNAKVEEAIAVALRSVDAFTK